MGDGWLWVKSLRTKESGIIFSALVEDMTKNADPNEGKGEGRPYVAWMTYVGHDVAGTRQITATKMEAETTIET